ncbi:Retrovirus-related Pol polyprotein from transposon RE1 [Vitis vinifera]|uniref:Retrovirus-related Pol polyprotein from transposon RE1 n=1 Tax=Vitis vinifera TaxID=29760 RepID=A0A438HE39_VITVI|nr:Retrovirus-related Pol polyprotein from transposon RE1 [Vitis vinifera]
MRSETSSNSMSSSVDSTLLPKPIDSNSTSPLPLVTINISSQLPYKLTFSNYPSWRATFLAILIGYDLMKYLDDTLRCPPKPAANSSVSVVTLYTHWYRHDRLLLNAIFASVSEAVMPLIGMTTTSCDAWQHLAHLFARKSRAQIMQLKEDLTLIQRGSHTVFEFHHAIKFRVSRYGGSHTHERNCLVFCRVA